MKPTGKGVYFGGKAMNTFKCWTAVLVAILLLPSVAASADAATEAYEKGKACLDKKDYDAAIVAFTRAIQLDPNNAKAYNRRGIAYEHKREHDKAIADYTEAIRLDPKYASAYYHRGVACGEKGDNDKAIADFTESIRLNPKDAKAYYDRGVAYWNKGEEDNAIVNFTEAVRLEPKLARAYYCRGVAYWLKGEHDKASEDFARAKKLGYVQQGDWLLKGLNGLGLPASNSLLDSPALENPSAPCVTIPEDDPHKLPGPFFLLPGERPVPRPPAKGPQPVPDEPDKR